MLSYADLLKTLVSQYHDGRITRQTFLENRSRLLDAADAQYNGKIEADDNLAASDDDITVVQFPS